MGSCDSCPNKKYVTVNHELLRQHLNGDIVLGTYPIHSDEKVNYAAVDLDDHKGDKDPLNDARKYYHTCSENNFTLYVLRSKSGTGYHAYLFFKDPLPASKARKVVFELLLRAGIDKSTFSENSFDRIFPNQDHLTGQKMGNLIALPFQGLAMQKGHTLLLDPNTDFLEPFENQVDTLSNINKVPIEEVSEFINTIRTANNSSKNVKGNARKQHETNFTDSSSDADFEIIREKCSFINHCVIDAETLCEIEWYVVLSVVSRCQNGAKIAHTISEPYPNYSQGETDKKIKHALKGGGPYTCAYIEASVTGDFCADCKYKDLIKSPISLGINDNNEVFNDVIPIDIFGDVDIFGEPEWLDNACPPVIDEFARDEAARLGVCTSMIAMPALTVAAACISDEYTVQPKVNDSEWKESSRIWSLLVAEPGMKKTPAMNKALKPLKELEKDLYLINQKLLKSYEQELAEFESLKKKKNLGGTPEKPEMPPLKRRMTNDPTVESLSEILKDNPEGILVNYDEMTRFIGSMDCYRAAKGGKDRADWLEMYNGGPRVIDRIKRGNIFVPNWSSCVLGSIQPGPAKREFASITDDGLLNRFDIYYGRAISEGEDREPDYEKIESYNKLIKNLGLPVEIDLPIPQTPYMFSAKAQEQREIVKRTIKNVMAIPSTTASFRAALDKWDGKFARYALTFHMVEAISENRMPHTYISGETAKRVARLMIAFLLPNAARFYNEILPTNRNIGHARWIAGFILAKGIINVSERVLYRSNRELRNFPDLLQEAMKILWAAGWVDATKYKKDHRPSHWRVNEQCHSLYANRANEEKQRRAMAVIKIQEATRFLGLSKHKDIQ